MMRVVIELLVSGFVVLLIALLSYLYRLYRSAAYPPARTIYETIPFLRPLNVEDLEDVVDQTIERYLEMNIPARQFKDVQRKRALRFLEHLGRMIHNSGYLSEWARHERTVAWMNRNTELEARCTEVVRACMEVNAGVRTIQLAILRWRLKAAVFPFARALHLAPLARFGQYHLLLAYERMADAALGLCHAIEPEIEEALGQAL